jgi:mono/diheme cytochrome c family protein
MTANIITVIALVAGIAWLGMLFVSAIRNRGGEEVAPNLRPGIDDEKIETRRLEGGQKAAIAFSAFLAISLPLYFLTEQERQAGFVDEFSTASVERGEHIVGEFACFSCHGPEGSGGTTSYVEKRSGVTVSWAVPSLDDVFFRYDEDEVNFWVTYGRGNTPMPAWGIPGGGPLNDEQVIDVVNYLKTIQVSQEEYLGKLEPGINTALDTLANADATVEAAILEQSQVVAEIEAAPADVAIVVPLAEQARAALDGAGSGIDTDADGVSDAAETELSEISAEAVAAFQIVEPVTLDPAVADAELADEALAALQAAVETDPIVQTSIAAIETAMSEGAVDPAVGLSEAALTILEETRAAAETAGIEVPASVENLEDANALVASLDEAAAAEEPVEGAADLAAAATAAVEEGSDPDGDGCPLRPRGRSRPRWMPPSPPPPRPRSPWSRWTPPTRPRSVASRTWSPPPHLSAISNRSLQPSQSPIRTRTTCSRPRTGAWTSSRSRSRPSSTRSTSPAWPKRWEPRRRMRCGLSASSTPNAPDATPPVTAPVSPTRRKPVPVDSARRSGTGVPRSSSVRRTKTLSRISWSSS